MTIKAAIDKLPHVSEEANMLRQHRGKPDIIPKIRESTIGFHNILYNDSALITIRCERSGNLLRVGLNDFRADSRDECQIFGSTTAEIFGPHTLFHVVPSFEGSFALRSLATGLYVKAVPPPSDNSKAPWKLVIGGNVVGSAEIFRLSEEGYLFSPLMGKYRPLLFIYHVAATIVIR